MESEFPGVPCIRHVHGTLHFCSRRDISRALGRDSDAPSSRVIVVYSRVLVLLERVQQHVFIWVERWALMESDLGRHWQFKQLGVVWIGEFLR